MIAVDTGGTKTLVARLSDDGVIEQSTKFPTPRNIDEYRAVLVNTIEHLSKGGRPNSITVALPGTVKNNVALWCPNLEWENVDMRTLLQADFHHATILVENDANLAGLGEAQALVQLPPSVLYVTISTGIGTGVIQNGHIDPALRYSEGGHMQLEFDDQVQAWEHFASGSVIYKTYGKYASDIASKETWRQIVYRFSLGFLALIPMVQPDIIIIGGSVGTHFEKYSEQLVGLLKEKLPPHIPCPEFRQALNPEEAVIYGCYYYAAQQLAS